MIVLRFFWVVSGDARGYYIFGFRIGVVFLSRLAWLHRSVAGTALKFVYTLFVCMEVYIDGQHQFGRP